MTTEEQPAEPQTAASATASARPAKKEDSFPVFLLKLFVIVVVFRSFILSPFNIPSESMLPRLERGDYLLASKWSYGYSKYSLPFSLPLIPGRLFASQPERGDVAIFKAPPGNDVDYIKRVIGLPGDQLQMISGVLHINGVAVKKEKLADAEYPVSPYNECGMPFLTKRADGKSVCRYPRFRETLPNGVSYNVLDLVSAPRLGEGLFDPDNTLVYVVPEGHLFMMGDNRDNSEDSRFDAEPNGGVGMVPQENLVGKAQVMMFSTDGSSQWLLPWTWFTAARWDRIGSRI